MTSIPHHSHGENRGDPIGRELHDLLDYEHAVDTALAVANWQPPAVGRPSMTTAEVYSAIRGRLAAHLIVKDDHGRFQVRPYVNLTAARRARDRAHARGCAATVVLVSQDVARLVDDGVSHGGRLEVTRDAEGNVVPNLRQGGAA